MAKNPKDINIVFIKDSTELAKKWPLFLTLGLLLILAGILGVIYSSWATVLTVEILGFVLIVGGVLFLIGAFQAKKWQGVALSILLGVLWIIAGGLCLFNPVASATSITLLLAMVFFVGGLFRMISALIYRFDYSWLWFLNGLVAFILGILILKQWPSSSMWVIGLFVGIDLIFSGISWVAVSLAAKRRLK